MNTKHSNTAQYRNSPLTRYTRNLLKKVNRGIDSHNLIEEGDRVCVSVSGGKDSLSLLFLLLEHIRFYPANYEVGAVHVVSDFDETADVTRSYLQDVFESAGVPYSFLDIHITTGEDGAKADPTCFWCPWNRRRAVFDHCVEKGYTKLAFGHHSDDVAETTLLNLCYHGNLDTMLPRRTFFDGKFVVIRPLFYVRERELVRFANLAGFNSPTCTCDCAVDGKRAAMKRLLRDLTKESRHLHANLWTAASEWAQTIGDHPLHKKEKRKK